MLDNIIGIRLMLLIGKTVPLSAPADLMRSFVSAEVTNDAERGDGFQLSFTLSKAAFPEFSLLRSGLVDTFNRVIIAIVAGVVPEVLIDGIITHHQLTPADASGHSTLTVTGKDVSIMLDLEEKNESFPNQPDMLIVTRILANYAQYGLVPFVSPTTDIPLEIERIPRQQETDLRFIERLASRNGYIFHIEPATFGVNTAYWGPENRLSVPQPALTHDMGAATNLKHINITNDSLAPVETHGSLLETMSKTVIPLPPIPPPRVPPLALSPIPARRIVLHRDTANTGVSGIASTVVSAATRTPDAVNGTGEIDVRKYGKILRARKLVSVRGVGLSHDGFYYVRSVTHRITKGNYEQSFTISREGVGALSPVVLP